jgi:hypothetical protein
MKEIIRCHAEIEEKLGEKLDLPRVDDPAILEYFVVEDEDGKIIGGLYLEKSIRQCHYGLDPRATLALREMQEAIYVNSRAAGVRFIHCQVPTVMAESITPHLEDAGFQKRDDLVDHTFDLRYREKEATCA